MKGRGTSGSRYRKLPPVAMVALVRDEFVKASRPDAIEDALVA